MEVFYPSFWRPSSRIKKSLEGTQPKNYKSILKNIELKHNETVSILHSNLVFSGISYTGNTFVVQGKPYVLKKELRIPFIGQMPSIGGYQTYIVNNGQYNELRKNENEIVLQGINFTDPDKSIELVMKIGMSKEEISKCIYTQVGIAFVLPALMGIIHSIMVIKALESFMHYRFISSKEVWDFVKSLSDIPPSISIGSRKTPTPSSRICL